MGVYHVEGIIGFLDGVHVAGAQRAVHRSARFVEQCRTSGDDVIGDVETDHVTRCNPAGEVDGDRARATPDIEQSQPGSEVRDEVGGSVLDRPPGVGFHHGVGVAVQV